MHPSLVSIITVGTIEPKKVLSDAFGVCRRRFLHGEGNADVDTVAYRAAAEKVQAAVIGDVDMRRVT